jgi:hypothetical protein
MIHAGSWVTRYSVPGGIPVQIWERSVPRISDQLTDCAVYIYRSLQDAHGGERQGGSGFLVGVRSEINPDLNYTYIVTNWHVVRKATNPVVRLNRKDGSTECLQTEQHQWIRHPHGDDVAVMPMGMQEPGRLRVISVAFAMFLTKELVTFEDIGIGDDTFMIGRFINHEGRQQNTPAIRFGSIAMMPIEPIMAESGIDQESFLVETRSLPGYSGSAVFIHSGSTLNDMSVRRFGVERYSDIKDKDLVTAVQDFFRQMKAKGPYLLGIDWCHIHSTNIIRDSSGSPVPDGSYVRENTGMAGVIPAWKIAEVINCEELTMQRKDADKKLSESADRVSLDTA